MQRTPTRQRKKATALSNAQPEFVSIVRTGANMMPFRSMKSEDQPENGTMQLKIKDAAHDIARIVFRGDSFADETAVQSWLDAGGYTDVKVVREEDGSFSVTDPEAPTEGLVEVEKDGVTVFIYQKQEAAQRAAQVAAQEPTAEGAPSNITSADGQPVHPVAKTDGEGEGQATPVVAATAEGAAIAALKTEGLEVMRRKFDSWDVEYSDELTLAGTLADGFDGVPPGFYEVMTALYAATRNAVIAGSTDAISTIFSDAAKVIQQLAAIFPHDIAFAVDAEVFLEEDSPYAAYRIKDADGKDALDMPKLLGDLLFPALKAEEPKLVLGAAKLAQKRDMSSKRTRILAKAALNKAKPNGNSDTDGNASDATVTGASTGADAGSSNSTKTEQNTPEAGQAAPAGAGDIAAAVAAALAPAISAMSDLTASVKKSFDDAQKASAAQVEQVQKTAQEAIDAVNAARVERQTRRSAEADETVTGTQETKQAKKTAEAVESVRNMRLRGALGMPRQTR